MPAAAIPAIIGAAGSIGGGLLSSHAQKGAAQTESDAAMSAADKQYQAAKESLDFQKQVYGDTNQNLSQYRDLGNYFAKQLGNLTDTNGAPTVMNRGAAGILGQFQAPTAVTEQNDPGFQFRLEQGQKALERSAAARGTGLSGGQMKALTDYAQGSASQEYGNVYNRALQSYQTNYNNLTNDANSIFNRLSTFMNNGQNAAVQTGSAGNAAANNISATNQAAANSAGNYLTDAASARAMGQTSAANSYNQMINGVGNSVSSYLQNRNSGNNGSGSVYQDIIGLL